jgi:hypothetical protein
MKPPGDSRMEPSDLLRVVANVFETLGLRYFVTGSTVTIFFGEPRFTNDIDIVVNLPESQVIEFCRQFPKNEFYVSEVAAREAVVRKTQFNIVHPASGLKVDVIIPQENPYNQSRFSRARRVKAGDDLEPYFASPEDAIIKKLEFYREGRSEKHVRDIVGVLKTNTARIDADYISRWVEQMGLADIWSEILKKSSQ